MKCRILTLSAFLLFMPAVVFAGWQVATPQSAMPNQPFFQAGSQQNMSFMPSYSGAAFPNQYAHLGRSAPVYAISISGSLKQNIERIMDRYHWRVVWKAPFDYNFDGRVTGASLPNVMQKLLQPFPLQAVMYMSNRTMTVTMRD